MSLPLKDFRCAITEAIDIALEAEASAFGKDKAAVAREVLSRWAHDERAFADALKAEGNRSEERAAIQARRRKPLPRRVTNAVFARDGFRCADCGGDFSVDQLHIDHVIPISAGGSDEMTNLRVLCIDCNLAKADKIVPFATTADDGLGRQTQEKSRR